MFKVGDNVRFVTDKPSYDAHHTEGELKVTKICSDGDIIVQYPDNNVYYVGYSQMVRPEDVERVTP